MATVGVKGLIGKVLFDVITLRYE